MKNGKIARQIKKVELAVQEEQHQEDWVDYCNVKFGKWYCSRNKGHEGAHVALMFGEKLLQVWYGTDGEEPPHESSGC